MRPSLRFPVLAALALAVCSPMVLSQTAPPKTYPEPSPYPIAWELKFKSDTPKRIVVDVPGTKLPQAYWYITYLVTNNTDREQMWLPTFQLVDDAGRVVDSDGKDIPSKVFDAIKDREGRTLMQPTNKLYGPILVGDGQAKEGVAIFPEPTPRMGTFSIFVSGLSGEVKQYTKADGGLKELKTGADFKDAGTNVVILRKTLQLNYKINGDEVFPGEDVVNTQPKLWVMR